MAPVLTERHLIEACACQGGIEEFRSFGKPEIELTLEVLTAYYQKDGYYLPWIVARFDLTGEVKAQNRFLVFANGSIIGRRHTDGTGTIRHNGETITWRPSKDRPRSCECAECRRCIYDVMPMASDLAFAQAIDRIASLTQKA